jgi:hypothetical protein
VNRDTYNRVDNNQKKKELAWGRKSSVKLGPTADRSPFQICDELGDRLNNNLNDPRTNNVVPAGEDYGCEDGVLLQIDGHRFRHIMPR